MTEGRKIRLKKVLDVLPKDEKHPNEPASVLVELESNDGDICQKDICIQLKRQVNLDFTMEIVELMLDYYRGLGWMEANDWVLPDAEDLQTMIGGCP